MSSEALILNYLVKRYAAPAYAFIPHCRNATGFSRVERTADAICMSLWPSRGLELMGFEVKISRSDWLRELKDPSKADAMFPYFDRFWLVISDSKIVADGELPAPWGLMQCGGSAAKVKVLREAPKLEAKPMTRQFLAAILRRAWEKSDVSPQLRDQYDKGFQAGIEAGRNESRNDYDQLSRHVAEFEKASGLDIRHEWDCGKIGRIVAMLRQTDREHIRRTLTGLQNTLRIQGDYVASALAEMEKGADPALFGPSVADNTVDKSA